MTSCLNPCSGLKEMLKAKVDTWMDAPVDHRQRVITGSHGEFCAKNKSTGVHQAPMMFFYTQNLITICTGLCKLKLLNQNVLF